MGNYWKNKNVVVTGGSSGLGQHIATEFDRQGANVTLVGRDNEKLEQAAVSLKNADSFSCDVTNDDHVDRLFEHIRKSPLHAFVNVVGKSDRKPIIDTTVQDFQRLIEMNFYTVVRCSRQAIPLLSKCNGHLVSIGSLASKSVSRFLGAYPASKFPLAAYHQQLRLEFDAQQFHSLLVCPGPIARTDSGHRYDEIASDLPPEARKPGGGVKVGAIDPAWLSRKILQACEKRQPELIVPAKARLLFAISQISPKWGDWILRKKTS